MRRRDLFRIGGGVAAVAGLVGADRWFKTRAARAAAPPPAAGLDCGADLGAASTYGSRFAPPSYLGAGARDALHTPPPPAPLAADVRRFELPVISTTLEVAEGQRVDTWAYGGTVPGPILRATVGQRMEVNLVNRTQGAHNVHFHGSHDVMQDGIERVAPGGSRLYAFEAGPVGLHPYHCHVPPYAWHLSRGMYGTLIVDPPGGRPPAHEFVLSLSGFDTDGDRHNDVYGWNGMAGYYERFPLKVPVGELVRLYLVNMVEYEPCASFHLHAQTFDLYRSGTSLTPHEHTDIVTLGQAERAIVEFRLPRRGRYMFHPHQSHMAERGAMGWVVAI